MRRKDSDVANTGQYTELVFSVLATLTSRRMNITANHCCTLHLQHRCIARSQLTSFYWAALPAAHVLVYSLFCHRTNFVKLFTGSSLWSNI